ncbi:NAD(P)H-quinone oxidoreductase [Rhodanobacter glycinis]|uniref:NAD(P)H-quinone oxidoreductase n=1 Tax=Rhodanobacter glycinis TaxID=582702 RepID=A0A502FPS7_9GAMM|nr:NAD(P)H-quinone oxidoreductase [Rhodanobacter glycinis]TPG04720.1 NAD(P)H-quinone oxidoreductase [Rhodanobacter glycinis]TPG51424.1 NAD(P)H-quinone oxidoreductase [Rhodanobacter glycinis]
MRAIEITRFGAPDVLQLARRPIPQAGPGEVLIKVAASGVNRPDVFQRQGHYAPPPDASDLPGLEVAGELVDGDFDGDNPFGLRRGNAVCALLAGGGYAEYVVAPLAQCLPVPGGLSLIEAAALPENYFTVWSNVFDRGQLGHGEGGIHETLLVQGGSSGIGVTAIQLAHAFGHRVFATAGSAEKCAACVQLGAELAINYRDEDFVAVVKQVTDGRGVDVILDMVAGDYIPREIDALAEGGRLVLIATLGGSKAGIDAATIMRRRLTLTGSTLRVRPVAFKGALARQLHDKVWPLLEAGKLRPVIHQVFPAAEAAQAHALMESSAHIGKLVLQW